MAYAVLLMTNCAVTLNLNFRILEGILSSLDTCRAFSVSVVVSLLFHAFCLL